MGGTKKLGAHGELVSLFGGKKEERLHFALTRPLDKKKMTSVFLRQRKKKKYWCWRRGKVDLFGGNAFPVADEPMKKKKRVFDRVRYLCGSHPQRDRRKISVEEKKRKGLPAVRKAIGEKLWRGKKGKGLLIERSRRRAIFHPVLWEKKVVLHA